MSSSEGLQEIEEKHESDSGVITKADINTSMLSSERVRNLAAIILIVGCFALIGSFQLAVSVGDVSPQLDDLSQDSVAERLLDVHPATTNEAVTNPTIDSHEYSVSLATSTATTLIPSSASTSKPQSANKTIIRLDSDEIQFPEDLTSGSKHSLMVFPKNGTTVRPYLTLLFEHNNGIDAIERQFLKPFAIFPESHVEFTFTMFTSGEFRVTIFDNAVLLDEPWTWHEGYFHLGPQKAVLHQFRVTFTEPPNSSTEQRLSAHLRTLPYCSLSDLADFQFGGRFLKPTLFPDANTSFVDTSKWIDKVGPQYFFLRFLPAKCQIYYFNVQESRDCVANKNITLMGDSTLAESVNRLIFHILDDYAEVHCPPSTENCHDRHYREGQLETTFNRTGPPSYLSLVWAPSLDVCVGFEGVWAFKDPMFADWLRFRTSYPESCRNYEDKLGLSVKTDWKNPKGVWRKLPPKEQDFVFFSSGLHDLIHWNSRILIIKLEITRNGWIRLWRSLPEQRRLKSTLQ
ncbi:hypothetical protein BCR33DRAFT_761457 [Rhizoclosmatium globosum]|uniref:Uncharacterized protein n=1 Tax=Rhizoclosmatium globosum TaxID=329046 RepID=A0A1Y2D3S4_9FUNG|nr:hypothetical protein BCR33DRAFT_761457 [Rhizoclosmatium globosum]|eukprot:ORY53215.1 hypothetical protein BCR33DRAFT_761457 [Rhizoclosmatium globosum]